MRTTLIDGLGHERGPRRGRFLLPERSRFSQIGHIIFRALVALKTSVPFACRFVACGSRIKVSQTDTQTDRPSTVTLAAHARRGLIIVRDVVAASLSTSGGQPEYQLIRAACNRLAQLSVSTYTYVPAAETLRKWRETSEVS